MASWTGVMAWSWTPLARAISSRMAAALLFELFGDLVGLENPKGDLSALAGLGSAEIVEVDGGGVDGEDRAGFKGRFDLREVPGIGGFELARGLMSGFSGGGIVGHPEDKGVSVDGFGAADGDFRGEPDLAESEVVFGLDEEGDEGVGGDVSVAGGLGQGDLRGQVGLGVDLEPEGFAFLATEALGVGQVEGEPAGASDGEAGNEGLAVGADGDVGGLGGGFGLALSGLFGLPRGGAEKVESRGRDGLVGAGLDRDLGALEDAVEVELDAEHGFAGSGFDDGDRLSGIGGWGQGDAGGDEAGRRHDDDAAKGGGVVTGGHGVAEGSPDLGEAVDETGIIAKLGAESAGEDIAIVVGVGDDAVGRQGFSGANGHFEEEGLTAGDLAAVVVRFEDREVRLLGPVGGAEGGKQATQGGLAG